MKKRAVIYTFLITVCACALVVFSGCMASGDANGGAADMYPGAENGAPMSPEADADAPSVEYGDEDYGKFIENEFIKTEDENVSTFSSDVDTASYSYFRKLVNSGYSLSELVNYYGNNVRTEEMINYFSYEGVTPEGNDLFGVKSTIAQCPWNEDALLLCLNLRAKEEVSNEGNNLVFLIDVSGSMGSDDKLPLLKKSFSYLVSQLNEKDRVSIVTYSGREAVVLEGCEGSKSDKIMKAVNSLGAKGSTNGEAGLTKAYEIAKRYYIEGGNNRIIMASDGDLNVGISSAEELKNYVTQKRNEGVFLSVLGFGTGNYKDANMEALANNGNGVYYYIDGATEAEKIFGDDLLSTLNTVAKDVKLQLTFDKDTVDSYRLVGYENRLLNKEDFTDDTKDAGDVGAGHTVTVCYELIMKEQTAIEKENASSFMTLAVAWKKADEDTSNYDEYTIGYESFTETPDSDFKFICAVIETAMILHKSEYAKNITLADVDAILGNLDLSGDTSKAEFRDLIRKLLSK